MGQREAAVNIIEKAGTVHGQQSRAIQVAVEFLFNTPGYGVTDGAMSAILDSPLTGKTYKLPPRTVSLIDCLKDEYGTHGKVSAAVAYMLSKPRLRDGVTAMPLPARENIVSYEPVPPLEKGETMAQRVEHEAAQLRKARRK